MVRLTLENYDHKTEKEPKKKKNSMPAYAQSTTGFFLEILKIVIITLAIILPIRYFLFQPFYVRGASMEPSYHDKDYLIIDEITYRFSDPKRGDVVVIRNPTNKTEFFIKRIIGLPGETLELKDGEVIIYNAVNTTGLRLQEEYLSPNLSTTGGQRVVLSESQYYVLGDNRQVSLDSRYFGALDRKNIIGRAWLKVWPFKEFGHFTQPEYSDIN
jgi:signal peptidase I